MQTEPTGAAAEATAMPPVLPVDDFDDALGYEAALPFLTVAANGDDGADGVPAVC